MTCFIYALALVGAITIAVIAAHAIGWWWKSRKWKPTPFLMPYGMPHESKQRQQGE